MASDQPIPPPANASPRSAAAYDQLLPEILAVAEDSVVPILIDIPTAVTTVLGVLPRIRALRPEIVETFRRFDLQTFDKLEQYTLAASHAHALHRAAHGPKVPLRASAGELAEVRDMLLADVRSLASHGLIHAERFAGCRATPGYRALAYDVLMLVQVLREAWSSVHDRTPVTLADLDRAAAMAEELLSAVGLRDQAAPSSEKTTVIRRKAFSLFMRAYAQARAVVRYLRAETGDSDEIAPSLYAGRTKRRRAAGNVPSGDVDPPRGSGGDETPEPEAPQQTVDPCRSSAGIPASLSWVLIRPGYSTLKGRPSQAGRSIPAVLRISLVRLDLCAASRHEDWAHGRSPPQNRTRHVWPHRGPGGSPLGRADTAQSGTLRHFGRANAE